MTGVRRVSVAAAIVLAVEAAALAVWAAIAGGAALPVVATLRSPGTEVEVPLATVAPMWALVAMLGGGAIAFAVTAARPRSDVWLLAGWSQGSAIIVFLIAQLNGIGEVTSLVPLYAIAGVAVALQGIDPGAGTPTWRRSGAWAAAIGIVPWGVIAFAQIGAGFTSEALPIGVRVVTLLALALVVYGWTVGWRRPGVVRPADVITMVAGMSVVVWATSVVVAQS